MTPLFGTSPSPLRCEPDDRALRGQNLPNYGRSRFPRCSGRFYPFFARSLRSLQNSPAECAYRYRLLHIHLRAAPEISTEKLGNVPKVLGVNSVCNYQ